MENVTTTAPADRLVSEERESVIRAFYAELVSLQQKHALHLTAEEGSIEIRDLTVTYPQGYAFSAVILCDKELGGDATTNELEIIGLVIEPEPEPAPKCTSCGLQLAEFAGPELGERGLVCLTPGCDTAD